MVNETKEASFLLPFDKDGCCPKCGFDGLSSQYYPDTNHYGCPTGLAMSTSWGPEHIERSCKQCHYRWDEAPLG